MATQSVSFSELEAAAKPQTSTEPAATTAATEPTAQAIPQFTDADIQSLRTLTDAGITPATMQKFLQSQSIVENLPKILKTATGVKAFLQEIQKADPDAYDTVIEATSDEWYEVKGKKLESQQPANGNASSTTTSAPDPRLDALAAKIDNLIADRNQEKSQRQIEQIQGGYDKSVEGLLAKLPEGVPDQAKDYIRLKTNELIWKDQSARDRVSKGVYVDVPKYFAEASAKATADTKAAADKEHARRAEVESRGTKEITPAAEPVNGTVQNNHEDAIWGDSGLVRDVQAALKASR